MKVKDYNPATHVELKGKFIFSINQSGLDFRDKEEKQEAIDDFWNCFNAFKESIENVENNFLTLDYEDKDLKVEEGE